MSAILSSKLQWELMNPILASTLNPLIANPTNSISIIEKIHLLTGTNVINHSLGRLMRGWFITDINGVSSIYRKRSNERINTKPKQ